MSSTAFEENNSVHPEVSKNAIGIRYGLMAGFVTMFLTTINYLYVLKANYIAFIATNILVIAAIAPITFYVIAIRRQRSLLGGYINIKEAFRVVFLVVLISSIMSTVYGLIYNKWIDPECVERMKTATYEFMAGVKVPEATINEKMAEFDESLAKSTQPGRLAFSVASMIVLQSILGFIVSMITKKERPAASFN